MGVPSSSRILAALTLVLTTLVTAQRPAIHRVITVATDGSGDARTMQEALDALPRSPDEWSLIRLPAGVLREKVFITKSKVAIVGAGKGRTRLEYPVLRSAWRAEHGDDDWGAGVVNIGDGVEDVILACLSVRNTYGDSTGNRDHQFAVRGFDATKIALLYCSISSAGGDALSLWNSEAGMYYHAYCSFEGWVDYVCPRGWCYISGSVFYGHNTPSASIWHDGSADEDQKFVIRRSRFDGVPGFPLGRHHRDAQFYLLDCSFSEHLADRPFIPPRSPNTVPWKWGSRHYFWNCVRPAGAYEWFADNLSSAKGSPRSEDVTAKWTFGGRWDPEEQLPSVLPFAALPQPDSGSYELDHRSVTLRWAPAFGATRSIVELTGPDSSAVRLEVDGSERIVGPLEPGAEYTWGVISIIDGRAFPSPRWTFRTKGEQ